MLSAEQITALKSKVDNQIALASKANVSEAEAENAEAIAAASRQGADADTKAASDDYAGLMAFIDNHCVEPTPTQAT